MTRNCDPKSIARLWMNSDHGVFSFNNSRPVGLLPLRDSVIFDSAKHLGTIQGIVVYPPEIVRENFERFGKVLIYSLLVRSWMPPDHRSRQIRNIWRNTSSTSRSDIARLISKKCLASAPAT